MAALTFAEYDPADHRGITLLQAVQVNQDGCQGDIDTFSAIATAAANAIPGPPPGAPVPGHRCGQGGGGRGGAGGGWI